MAHQASRSFKPASYLTRSPRPSFTRSSSASSTKSTTSEDSFINSLKGLYSNDTPPTKSRKRDSTGSVGSSSGVTRSLTPVNNSQPFDDTPGRKRSQPIAIELPPRKPNVYTPLTARGDLPGGYFPNHEPLPSHYRPHPFSKYYVEKKQDLKQEETPLPPIMSNNSSAFASPSDTTPRGPPQIMSPSFPAPELSIPMGKYHPSNFTIKPPTKQNPTSAPNLGYSNMDLPPTIPDRKKKRPTHERHGSDVKRKLQEYQLGQAKQAQMLAQAHGGTPFAGPEPISPRLLPLGSPGPITPFELEDSTDAGYVVAGARARTSSLISRGLERGRDRDLVGHLIRAEEDRRRMLRGEGSRSPRLRV